MSSQPPSLLLVGLLGAVLVNHFAVLDYGLALVLLVVFVLDGHADPLRPALKVQRVVRLSVRGKPILAVDLLAVSFELRELVVRTLLQQSDALAVGLDDL